MNHPFINRWSPAVVALRWRHLFWCLPLLALLIGGGREWQGYQHDIQARGVIQREDTATLSMAEIRELLLSDAVLQEAASRSGYLKEWNATAAEDLRKIIHCEEIHGTSLLAIMVNGRNTLTKASLCDWLPVLASSKASEMHGQRIMDTEAALEALNKAHKENGQLYSRHVKISLDAPQEPFVPTPESLEAKRKFEESAKALETARNAYIDLRLQSLSSGAPIAIIEKAAAPVPFTPMELIAPSARTSCWVGGSALLAALLAYFLEWRFPRPARRPAFEHPGNAATIEA